MAQQAIPATRESRNSLESFSFPEIPEIRGLRTKPFERIFRLSPQRERKKMRNIIELPYNPARLDLNREVKQALAIQGHKQLGLKGYNDIRKAQFKNAVKPLYTIRPDMSIKVDLPPEHPICIQREQRRELLFAFNKAGKGGQRPRRLDNNITLRCK